MDSIRAAGRIEELADEVRFRAEPELADKILNYGLKVKFRVQVGDRVMVMDLEPEMIQLKEWGSGSESVILIDLT